MCHKTTVRLGCGHKSSTLSSIASCRRLAKLQQDEDKTIRLFSRYKKLTDCGNLTREDCYDEGRICGSCYEKRKQEKRERREREQREEVRRNERNAEILRDRVEQDRRERERREQEKKKAMERAARRQREEMEEERRRHEKEAYPDEMARKMNDDEKKKNNVVSPIPSHFAQAAFIDRGSPVVDRSQPFYGPGPSRDLTDPVDDIVNIYQQRSPVVDVSQPFNPGFRQAVNPTNPKTNRNPGRRIGLGIYVPGSENRSGLRRYFGRPTRPSQHVLDKARAKGKGRESKIPFPPGLNVTFDATNKPDRSRRTEPGPSNSGSPSSSSSSSGESKASGLPPPPEGWRRDRNYHPRSPVPRPVPQGPNPTAAHHIRPNTDKQPRPPTGTLSASFKRVLAKCPPKTKTRRGKVSRTLNTLLAGRKTPSPLAAGALDGVSSSRR
ncbi:uncharacterized protein PODANS_1_16705 [Podospora anserina S mat+]|uniref:Podospora anserina S mat+ genomic DNA chromosome 1, supercontig 4 n=1 Tax=Podospora anserina (strain S / ATCC MYA-4624 / DSM 980 / FGSC 10383) TaxID=515849 RepID=B2ATR4_PODAN|nr:uncharacterized protein PODANS_1_16705 [Podospora anserina S mat+]CAP67787.1 unnamed protein product [Podospora anserina S mat+]